MGRPHLTWEDAARLIKDIERWSAILEQEKETISHITPGNAGHRLGSVRHSLGLVVDEMRDCLEETPDEG